MELVMGVGPMNLVITNDALYQLSYTSIPFTLRRGTQREHYSEYRYALQAFFAIIFRKIVYASTRRRLSTRILLPSAESFAIASARVWAFTGAVSRAKCPSSPLS